jgi:hypothetical protein
MRGFARWRVLARGLPGAAGLCRPPPPPRQALVPATPSGTQPGPPRGQGRQASRDVRGGGDGRGRGRRWCRAYTAHSAAMNGGACVYAQRAVKRSSAQPSGTSRRCSLRFGTRGHRRWQPSPWRAGRPPFPGALSHPCRLRSVWRGGFAPEHSFGASSAECQRMQEVGCWIFFTSTGGIEGDKSKKAKRAKRGLTPFIWLL